MSDDTTPAPEGANGAENIEEAAGEPAAEGRQAQAAKEVAEAKDRVLRTLAEMENLRRRTEREIADAKSYAIASFARDMLTVADNLKRAIAAVPPEARSADPALSNLMDGVEATERGLEQTLTRYGVRAIEAKGQKFDPAKHQAMYEVELPDSPSGMVAEVVQGGYVIGERVLRPAMVAVSKGGPKAPAPAEGDKGAS
jgi:molecular chaperone GrpE